MLKTADTLHEDLHAFLCASAAKLAKYLTAQNMSKHKSFRDEHSTHDDDDDDDDDDDILCPRY